MESGSTDTGAVRFIIGDGSTRKGTTRFIIGGGSTRSGAARFRFGAWYLVFLSSCSVNGYVLMSSGQMQREFDPRVLTLWSACIVLDEYAVVVEPLRGPTSTSVWGYEFLSGASFMVSKIILLNMCAELLIFVTLYLMFKFFGHASISSQVGFAFAS